MKKLLVKNIGLLATPEGKSAHRGSEQGKIKFLKDAWVLIEDGVIASVGTGEARGRPYAPYFRRLAAERAGHEAARQDLS